MWSLARSNRIISEREKVKVGQRLLSRIAITFLLQDHVMHIERLRQIKPTITITGPKKPSHLKTNAKREMTNLGKLSPPTQIITDLNDLSLIRTHERNLVPKQNSPSQNAAD